MKAVTKATTTFLLSCSLFLLACSTFALQRQPLSLHSHQNHHHNPTLLRQPWGIHSENTILKTDRQVANHTRQSHAAATDNHMAYLDTKNENDTNDMGQSKDSQEHNKEEYRDTDLTQSPPPPPPPPPRMVLMGAPSSGKGTQSELIVKHYNVVHLSTGDMLREAVQRERADNNNNNNNDDRGTSRTRTTAKTGLGAMIQSYMDRGELVPDEIMIQLVLHRLSQSDCRERGWILDGFPRTRTQAEAMTKFGIHPNIVLHLHVPDTALMERVLGRRVDPQTNKIYHLTMYPPPTNDIRNRLVQRSDDTKEKLMTRLDVFHAHVQAVREFYDNVFVQVNGVGTPEEIAQNVFDAIDRQQQKLLVIEK